MPANRYSCFQRNTTIHLMWWYLHVEVFCKDCLTAYIYKTDKPELLTSNQFELLPWEFPRARVLPSFLLATLVVVDGFQFMKNWKLPTRNKNAEIIQDRFGTNRQLRKVLAGCRPRWSKVCDLLNISLSKLQNWSSWLATGEYHVIGGVQSLGGISECISSEHFTPFECDLESMGSVSSFCD